MRRESRPDLSICPPDISLEIQLCKKSIHVRFYQCVVILAGAICPIGAIKRDHSYDLTTIGGITRRQIEAVQIFVGVSRRIFFITSSIGEHDIDSDKTGHPAVITTRIRGKGLERVLPVTVDWHRNTEVSRTHIPEAPDITRLTDWCTAVYLDACALIIDIAWTPMGDGSFDDDIDRQ